MEHGSYGVYVAVTGSTWLLWDLHPAHFREKMPFVALREGVTVTVALWRKRRGRHREIVIAIERQMFVKEEKR